MSDAAALATPRDHLSTLVVPSVERIRPALTRVPEDALRAFKLLDTNAALLKQALFEEQGWTRPVVMTGHQVEFFHAGVLAKTMAAHTLARQHGGTAAFLVADLDVPKDTALAVPQIVNGRVERLQIALPPLHLDRPAEYQPKHACAAWRTAFDELAAATPWREQTPLADFVSAWQASCALDSSFNGMMQAGRLAAERAIGLDGVAQAPMSELAQSRAFRTFAGHLLINAERVFECYNGAQADYRRRHKLRNPQRPVPPLQREGERFESPFWAVRPHEPRRRLFVTRVGTHLRLDADGLELGGIDRAELEQSDRQAEPWDFEQSGWFLRPRALTLSSFARLLGSDLFIHGIGGAKYDEVTEHFIERFFGEPLPQMACVTATAYLPVQAPDVTAADVRVARRRRRDVRFNPQRYIADLPHDLLDQRSSLIMRSDSMRGSGPRYRNIRRKIFEDIRAVNHRLVACAPERERQLAAEVARREHRLRETAIAQDREYFFALHPTETLVALKERIAEELTTP